ncbi:hypothetical protein OAI_00055 [Vibrio cyclitrophicus FF160]|nr:hypothetical protein OAI_00055 [Vibrio cyclitrophicus FF160]PMJ19142.1 hypothetical protein BCU28_15735 [Vibrio cyclitrophicus]
MQKEFDFKWLAHPTKEHRDNGENMIELGLNSPLPSSYIENPNYKLELCMREKNTDKWVYKSNKISTKHLNVRDLSKKLPCGEKIPQRCWDIPITEFLKRGLKVSRDSIEQLKPLIWWPALIISSYLFSKHLNFEDLLIAISTLITENNSVPTISLGGVAYTVSLTIYFLIPLRCSRTERFFFSIATNFYGLLVGAMSFVIASRLLNIATVFLPQYFNLVNESNRTIYSLIGELVFLSIFALSCQYLYGLFVLMNKHASVVDRIRLLGLLSLAIVILLVVRCYSV